MCSLLVQIAFFKFELQQLNRKGKLSTKSSLLPLIYIQNHLLRVGGRRFHSLLEQDAHQRTLHGGVLLTLDTLRRQYWIVKGRAEVEKVIRA